MSTPPLPGLLFLSFPTLTLFPGIVHALCYVSFLAAFRFLLGYSEEIWVVSSLIIYHTVMHVRGYLSDFHTGL